MPTSAACRSRNCVPEGERRAQGRPPIVRSPLPRGRRAPLDGLGRRRLRQCDVRELLRHAGSRRRPRRGSQCSSSSRASTIRDAVIRRSGISPHSTTSVVMRPIPTHTSLPPCSRRSRTSPSGGPQLGPSLTAAARDGRTIVRAGMKEWLRQGPNKRMTPDRRAKCRHVTYTAASASCGQGVGSPFGADEPEILRPN
jgi:hypothetical protein